MPVGLPFDGYIEYPKRISPTRLVTFERNRYSVPSSFASRPVSLYFYLDCLTMVAENQVIAEHTRLSDRRHRQDTNVYDWWHYF